MLREMDRDELAEWMAFSRLEPLESATALTAQLCSMLAAIGGQTISANQFLGIDDQTETANQIQQQDQVNQSVFEGFAEAWFIKEGREAEYREWERKRSGDDSRSS